MKNQHSIRRSILRNLKPKVKALWTTMPNAKPVTAKKPKRIARRTKQRAAEERKYNARVKVWLALPENQKCKACPKLVPLIEPEHADPATENHHIFGRRKELLSDERFWLPVCQCCHDLIHRYPNQARELGLLAPLGQWNQIPKQ